MYCLRDIMNGTTVLGKVHGHLFLLGMMVFLLVALFSAHCDFEKQKTFHTFMLVYNVGLPLTSVMFFVRGIVQVLGIELSKGANASISGIAGIGHILLGVGIVLLLLSLKKSAKD